MLAIALDPTRIGIGLVGRGERAVRRLRELREGGACALPVFSDRPDPALTEAAGDDLRPALPDANALAALHVLWIVDLPPVTAARLAEQARAAGVLANVEDVRDECDFHNVAQVRRGDLLLTVSTGGRSPALAARIRRALAESFGPEWAGRLAAVSAERRRAREAGLGMQEVTRMTEGTVERNGWLSPSPREIAR